MERDQRTNRPHRVLPLWRPGRRHFVQVVSGAALALAAGIFPEIKTVGATGVVFCSDSCNWCCSINGNCSCYYCVPGYWNGCGNYAVSNDFYINCEAVFGCNSCGGGCTGPWRQCSDCCGCCAEQTDVCYYCRSTGPYAPGC